MVCKWVRLACQRHLADLAKAKGGWTYYFDEAKANHVCRFIENLPHTKGHWAAELKTISLEPWQCFVLCSIFGWLKTSNRKRRFTIAYVAVPRKNGKSIIAGGIGNYMFAADGEFGAEVYSGATTEKQAWEVFRPAKMMVERTPDLKAAFGIDAGKPGSNASVMTIPGNGSRFGVVIGKPGDGAMPHCGIVDEYHEHDTDTLVDTLRTGMGARKQPLLLVITTAGDNLAGPCKALQEDLEHVLSGSMDREELFGVVYTIDPNDDWTSEASLRKANPNFDVSVFGEFLLTEQKNAIVNARKQNIFKTKHLNVWVGSNSGFINIQKWNELADTSLTPDEFRGLPCYAGVDMASSLDISARVFIFEKEVDGKPHYYLFGSYYLPEERASRPEFQHYQGWSKQGFLKTTPGNMIDFEQLTQDTVEEVVQYGIREIGYDKAYAGQYAQEVERRSGVAMIEVPQRVMYLSPAMKQMEALIIDGRLHHDGNPLMTWMMGNLVAHTDANDNVFPRKQRDESKIDGPVALILAISRATVAAVNTITYVGLQSVNA